MLQQLCFDSAMFVQVARPGREFGYLVFCPECRTVSKTNMYLQSAETYLENLLRDDIACPGCGAKRWALGYPMGSKTGFVKED